MADDIIGGITAKLQGIAKSVAEGKKGRLFVEVPRESLLRAAGILKNEFDAYHISTITVLDSGENFEIIYHIPIGPRLVNLRVFVPKKDPSVESLTAILPGAILYERELNDIMGIQVKNHPDMRRLLLPDSWDRGYPLRKDWVDPKAKGVK